MENSGEEPVQTQHKIRIFLTRPGMTQGVELRLLPRDAVIRDGSDTDIASSVGMFSPRYEVESEVQLQHSIVSDGRKPLTISEATQCDISTKMVGPRNRRQHRRYMLLGRRNICPRGHHKAGLANRHSNEAPVGNQTATCDLLGDYTISQEKPPFSRQDASISPQEGARELLTNSPRMVISMHDDGEDYECEEKLELHSGAATSKSRDYNATLEYLQESRCPASVHPLRRTINSRLSQQIFEDGDASLRLVTLARRLVSLQAAVDAANRYTDKCNQRVPMVEYSDLYDTLAEQLLRGPKPSPARHGAKALLAS